MTPHINNNGHIMNIGRGKNTQLLSSKFKQWIEKNLSRHSC
jgi:hypothetical protein